MSAKNSSAAKEKDKISFAGKIIENEKHDLHKIPEGKLEPALGETGRESPELPQKPEFKPGSGNTPLGSDAVILPDEAEPGTDTGGAEPETEDSAYMKAVQALLEAEGKRPDYTASYDDELEKLLAGIMARGNFSYDADEDALYQKYKEDYVNLGRMAMMDTMGQAAALTGGYGSSYGQAVGQQQYDDHLQKLGDVLPELYSLAYDKWSDEGDRMLEHYRLLGDMADGEYARYQDALEEYYRNLDYLQGRADDEYDREQDRRTELMKLISSAGYMPAASELSGSGLSKAQAEALRNEYLRSTGQLEEKGGAVYYVNSKTEDGNEKKLSGKHYLDLEKMKGSRASESSIANYIGALGKRLSLDAGEVEALKKRFAVSGK